MPFVKPRVSGAIFANEYPTGPTYKGFVEIDGVKTEIVLWEKTSQKTGKPYLQVAEDKKKQQQVGGGAQGSQRAPAPQYGGFAQPHQPPTKPKSMNSDMDDDIPF